MKTDKVQQNVREAFKTVLLVNADNNPDAEMDADSFNHDWSWVNAPEGWTADNGIPEGVDAVDAVIVFSTKYEEHAIRELCESIRSTSDFAGCPLLVSVTQYEMPLANRVKEMPGADFVFMPIREDDLLDRLRRAQEPS